MKFSYLNKGESLCYFQNKALCQLNNKELKNIPESIAAAINDNLFGRSGLSVAKNRLRFKQ